MFLNIFNDYFFLNYQTLYFLNGIHFFPAFRNNYPKTNAQILVYYEDEEMLIPKCQKGLKTRRNFFFRWDHSRIFIIFFFFFIFILIFSAIHFFSLLFEFRSVSLRPQKPFQHDMRTNFPALWISLKLAALGPNEHPRNSSWKWKLTKTLYM